VKPNQRQLKNWPMHNLLLPTMERESKLLLLKTGTLNGQKTSKAGLESKLQWQTST
jgi:hypothetical protein